MFPCVLFIAQNVVQCLIRQVLWHAHFRVYSQVTSEIILDEFQLGERARSYSHWQSAKGDQIHKNQRVDGLAQERQGNLLQVYKV